MAFEGLGTLKIFRFRGLRFRAYEGGLGFRAWGGGVGFRV